MPFGVIFATILVFILLYFLYVYYYQTNLTYGTKYDLNVTNPAFSIKNKNLSSTRYSYGVWIYVNSWNNTNEKNLIARDNSFLLFLDKNTPTLKYKLIPDNSSIRPIDGIVTNNFPLQKWTYFIISVDNQVVDIYLDGKLVSSKKINYMPKVSKSDNILIGPGIYPNSFNDIFLTSIEYIESPMDPQTAWNKYLNGNGLNNNTSTNLRLSVLQNNVEQSKISLF